MENQNRRKGLDGNVTFIGILIGFVIGVVYALLNIKHRGEITRKNLTQFGAGSLEQEMDSSLNDAKQQAQKRRQKFD